MLSNMEAADIALVEPLHLGNLQESIIIVLNSLIPFQRSPFFNGSGYIISFDDIFRNLCHVATQDALVDAPALPGHQSVSPGDDTLLPRGRYHIAHRHPLRSGAIH